MNFKEELAAKAENTAAAKKNDGIKLTTNMSIVDMIKTLVPKAVNPADGISSSYNYDRSPGGTGVDH